MKVLWITDKPLPRVSEHFGFRKTLSQGWLIDIACAIAKKDDIQLAIASTYYTNKYQTANLDGATHYIIPDKGRFLPISFYNRYWDKIIDEFQPDVVHIHGTEYLHGLAFVRRFPNIRKVLTIQGIMTRIEEEYFGGLSLWDVITNRTRREIVSFGGMLGVKLQYKQQKRIEQEIIRKVDCVTGRTWWDYSIMKRINPKIRYYRCNYNLRPEFYEAKKWDYDSVNPQTIYTSFANYPLKGLHILLRAIAIVKKACPSVTLIIPGMDGDQSGKLIVNSGYKKYISKLICTLEISANVRFIGGQSAQNVVENMQRANLVVVPSAIEGASATVCEAMYIGTPCICTFRGGMTELLRDGESGFYYDYLEYQYLAERIVQIFSNPSMAKEFSQRLIADAELRHNREKNPQDMIDVYFKIHKGNGE